MIFEDVAQYRSSGFTPQIVIIGAGPAGITIARKLANARIPCTLLDAGGVEQTEESQDVYRGKIIGDPYFDLDTSRLRYFGGTSGHWGGWCRFLDAHDFEKRDWIPNSGWPIGREAIEPHFAATREILGLREFAGDVPVSSDISQIDLIRSDPVRFGEKYSRELASSTLIAVVLNTYATDLVAESGRVIAANIRSNRLPAGKIEAARFVAATGGIENSRLLLWSNETSPDPVVPEPSALGRYWMEHPEFHGGDAYIENTGAYRADEDGWAFFAPTPGALRANRLTNFHAVIMEQSYYGAKKLIADLACTAPEAARWLAAKAGKDLVCAGRVGLAWEQAPLPENRVALSRSATDYAGIPRVELYWKKGELERRTLLEGLKLFGATLATKDIGRLRIDEWVLDGGDYPTNQEMAGHHHMGGTRMGADPRTSVVDPDCRVHGMRNLYVAGSSIFATSGYANPTSTIVAFAERLGAHLAEENA